MKQPCGVLFRLDFHAGPNDPHGCHLPDGHGEIHEFTTPEGRVYQWETDWECDCDHCQLCEGDYCMIYWEVDPRKAIKPD